MIINGRKFKHFTEETLNLVKEAGINASPKELETQLGIDARRISDLQYWLGLKTNDYLTEQQATYVKENRYKKIEDLAKELNINQDSILNYIKKHKLRGKISFKKIDRSKYIEYEADLKDPTKTHAELGLKWNVSANSIGASRKTRNLGVWRKNFDTIPELKFKQILETLDLAYIHQKKIDVWNIDFYLGNKICIDINGTWVHSKEKIIERDLRKTEFLKENNYFYLTINEEELEDTDTLSIKISNFFWVSLAEQFANKNFVNPIT